MKAIILIISTVVFYSCSSQRVVNTTTVTKDSLATVIKTGEDSLIATTPACVQLMIKKYKFEERQNPPRSVFRYTYNEKIVYYVPAICCDFFSDLYDDQCNLIGHPDGGFTGRGDGKAADFKEVKADGQLIWIDNRK